MTSVLMVSRRHRDSVDALSRAERAVVRHRENLRNVDRSLSMEESDGEPCAAT